VSTNLEDESKESKALKIKIGPATLNNPLKNTLLSPQAAAN